eukprot:TRINITY_DN9288_c0_g1_i1.p1 TRINITY_DN9288_c0_g1~~TRINITY_DN9288_c0_g1_i1.p1  ORF type:complete len:350 (-),score=74.79 TRINITY_DN9288_c0_g1_i1:948-1946(-)
MRSLSALSLRGLLFSQPIRAVIRIDPSMKSMGWMIELPMAALPYASVDDLNAANMNSTRLLRDYLADKVEADALYMDTFVKRSSIMTVYLSNKLEQTFVGTAAPAAIHAMLEKIYDEQAAGNATPDTAAAVEATDTEERRTRQQLWQHMAALKYLCFQCAPGSKPFTVDMLLRTHHLLMEGLSDDDGKAVTTGAFRTTPCHSGTGFTYSEAQNIQAEVQSAVDNFNAALTAQHPVQAAADLFYAVITTHPFEDGNGRLCRLLASYAFMCAGVPFPAPLCNGHRRSAMHLMRCLRRADAVGDRRSLYSYFLLCLAGSWSYYEADCQRQVGAGK